jgi:hypothetical protein
VKIYVLAPSDTDINTDINVDVNIINNDIYFRHYLQKEINAYTNNNDFNYYKENKSK